MKQLVYWLGTEESAHRFNEQMARQLSYFSDDVLAEKASSGDDEEENPVRLDIIQNKLALIRVEGQTVAKGTWLTRLFGVASYTDIQQRIVEASDNENVKASLLVLDTPGGEAQGVSKLGNFIKQASTKVKPILTFADGSMASAGLWYGTASSQVIADEDSRIGSLGVIAIHMDYTKRLDEMGIKPTVFRTSPYKALGNPYEVLSEEASEEIKKELQVTHNSFVSAVARNRKLSDKYVQDNVATGRMYRAEEAKSLKMVDRILSLDETIARMLKALDNSPAA